MGPTAGLKGGFEMCVGADGCWRDGAKFEMEREVLGTAECSTEGIADILSTYSVPQSTHHVISTRNAKEAVWRCAERGHRGQPGSTEDTLHSTAYNNAVLYPP